MSRTAKTNPEPARLMDATSPYQDCVAPRINQHRGPGTDRQDEWAGGRKGRADRTSPTDPVNGKPVNSGRR